MEQEYTQSVEYMFILSTMHSEQSAPVSAALRIQSPTSAGVSDVQLDAAVVVLMSSK